MKPLQIQALSLSSVLPLFNIPYSQDLRLFYCEKLKNIVEYSKL